MGLAAFGLAACGPGSTPERAPGSQSTAAVPVVVQAAPDSVVARLQILVASLDPERPGASAAQLRGFLETHSGYTTDAIVGDNLKLLGEAAEARYQQAREFARRGDFDVAEAILVDLATHLPDSPGGRMASDHLAFDFHLNRAHHHLYRQRFDEAAEIVTELRGRDLTVEQSQMVEQILDNVGHVNAAKSLIERQQGEAEVRQIMLAVVTEMVTENEFPADLTLPGLRRSQWFSGSLDTIARIEGYRTRGDTYSFTAITRSGHRIEVVDGQLRRHSSR